MLRPCTEKDIDSIFAIINDASCAYKGVIPPDCWHEPYMSREYLQHELDAGVLFHGCEEQGALIGVMGTQDVRDVTLIRHAYVRTTYRGKGIGGTLLTHLKSLITMPALVGTWSAATWAVRFYEKYGFALVSWEEKEQLLRTYWSIPERQTETSVVLADQRWRESRKERQP